jgi:hypothetical protein
MDGVSGLGIVALLLVPFGAPDVPGDRPVDGRRDL